VRVNEAEARGLVRYWFEFGLDGLRPEPRNGISVDDGSLAYRFCSGGIGVSGYDEGDCLELVRAQIPDEPLPPVLRSVRNADVAALRLDMRFVAITAWRGIWYPPINRAGPVVGSATQ
jgi:hypothetical protein